MLVKVVSSMFEYKNTSLFLEKMPPSVELGSSPNLDFKLPPFRVLSRPRKCCDNQDFLILDSTCLTILDFVLRGPQVGCNLPWRRILWIKFDWETLLKIFCPLPVVRPRYTELRADSVLFQPFHIGGCRHLYSSLLGIESTLCKTPHFQWIYGKLNQIYENLKTDQMDQKSTLGGPKLISRIVGSLLKNWSYTSIFFIYFGILLDWK